MKKFLLIIFMFILTSLSGCLQKNEPDPLLESDYLNHDVEYKRDIWQTIKKRNSTICFWKLMVTM